MAHPDRLRSGSGVGQQGAGIGHRELGAAVLAPLVTAHIAAALVGDELGAVADPEDRHPELVDAGVNAGGAFDVDGCRSPREDDPGWLPLRELGGGQVVGNDLAEDAGLAHPSCDQLGVLRAEVDHEDAVAGNGGAT